MELVQVHSMQPLTAAGLGRVVRGLVSPTQLHRRAALDVAVTDPWRPADHWPGSLERLVWTAVFETPGGAFLTELGEAALGAGTGLARRQAPVHPAELAVRASGEGLVVVWSDAARLAYVAVYRERHLRWSLLLEDRVRLVRCDGEVVLVDRPPRWVPEGDRVGVLIAGFGQWLREPLVVADEDRFVFPDRLDALTAGAERVTLVRDGAWVTGDRERGPAYGRAG